MLSMEDIYRKHASTVYRYLLLQTNNEHLAEELTQETFYQAVKSIGRFDGRSKVSTWLIGIAKNLLYQNRKKYPVMEEFKEYCEKARSAETECIELVNERELIQLIEALGEPAAEVVRLRIVADLSFRDIGKVMGKSENWARVTFYRAKEKLRKEIDDYEI